MKPRYIPADMRVILQAIGDARIVLRQRFDWVRGFARFTLDGKELVMNRLDEWWVKV